jgi:transposase
MTRQKARENGDKRTEYDTPAKNKFFNAYDTREPGKGIRKVAAESKITKSTAQRWVTKRRLFGADIERNTRIYTAQPGPKPKVSTDVAKQIVNPNTNPIRHKSYRDQAKYFGIDAHLETIQKSLKKNTRMHDSTNRPTERAKCRTKIEEKG